ncbi:MAG: Uma2 family endonuclease [Chloroherpetonaceae bacterium]|nr:Uma2 family endonuclease [Chloroherpetonaceae bacterium]
MIAEKTRLTEAEYLALERQSQERHEYCDGERRLMAGASRKHNIIAGNIFSLLHQRLRGKPCKPHMSDLRLWIESARRYYYPDIAIICGKEPFIKDDLAIDATVIVEVLSDSTEAIDRDEKLVNYRRLPSLHDYVLVSQNETRVEHFRKRSETEWQGFALAEPDRCVQLEEFAIEIPLKEIYADVEFI